MTALSVRWNTCVDQWNILKKPTESIGHFFERHPTAYKVALIINHLFRAGMMVGFMFIPQVPLAASMSICLLGSLFYRLTVEKNCAYKFALPAFAGAAAFMLALPAFIAMINGMGFTTVAIGFKTVACFLPFALYGAYIVLTVDYDVERTLGRKKGAVQPQQEETSKEPDCRCRDLPASNNEQK